MNVMYIYSQYILKKVIYSWLLTGAFACRKIYKEQVICGMVTAHTRKTVKWLKPNQVKI